MTIKDTNDHLQAASGHYSTGLEQLAAGNGQTSELAYALGAAEMSLKEIPRVDASGTSDKVRRTLNGTHAAYALGNSALRQAAGTLQGQDNPFAEVQNLGEEAAEQVSSLHQDLAALEETLGKIGKTLIKVHFLTQNTHGMAESARTYYETMQTRTNELLAGIADFQNRNI